MPAYYAIEDGILIGGPFASTRERARFLSRPRTQRTLRQLRNPSISYTDTGPNGSVSVPAPAVAAYVLDPENGNFIADPEGGTITDPGT